jgi:3-oxoacyl-[acyl-carrier-protein] synthase-1
MMRDNFIAPSINIETIDPLFADLPIVRNTTDAKLNHVMSNSFGFGGTNGSILLSRI